MWNLELEASSDDEDDCNAEEQKNDLLNLQLGRINAFKAQDAETGNYDITFDLSGKLLYAHKIMITTVSTTMEAWISDRWSNKNDIIKIETYTFEEFFQFLLFLYSGTCQITEDNIFRLIDMAEFFDVGVMKSRCDKHVSKMITKIGAETVEEIWEMAQRYSLSNSIDALKDFIRRNMLEILSSDRFVNFKSSFLDVLFSVKTYKAEEQFFLSVVKWCEHQVSTKEPTLEGTDFLDAVKVEFDAMQEKFDFSRMGFDFVIESVVSKDYLFSTFECCDILGECIHAYYQYEIHGERYLKTIFEIVERDALKERTTSVDENFNVLEAMKRELFKILPIIQFCCMKFEIVKEIIVDKAFLFSSKKMYRILAECQRPDEEKYLKAMFELVESESLKEQATSVDENFNLQSVMKRALFKIIPTVKFRNMKFEVVKEILVDKAFLFSSRKMYKMLAQCPRSDEEKYLTDMFEFIESESLKKQNASIDENFNLQYVMKRELSKILPTVDFKRIKFDFVKQFVADKAQLIYAKELYEILAKCQRTDDKESELFEMLYELAKNNVENRNLPGEILDLPNAIKAELAECLPKINFHKMDEKYLIDFAAKTDLITDEQAKSCFHVRVQVYSGGKLLIGSFEDILDIRTYDIWKHNITRNAAGWTFGVTPRSDNKLRFTGLKFNVPSSPSNVQQMRGADWYLLLEKDGILTAKHQSLIKRGEYLIAELRSTEEFSFALKQKTQLTVSHNTIF